LLDVRPDGDVPLPVDGPGGGPGAIFDEPGGGDVEILDNREGGDARILHGGGGRDDGNDFDRLGFDGVRDGGGGEFEGEELVDGELLRGEHAVETFERERTLAIEEVRDVSL
jgi:hypothetical protein